LSLMEDGPRLLTGSEDGSIKIWNLATLPQGQPEVTIPLGGPIQHIETKFGNSIMCSLDSFPVSQVDAVGEVHLLPNPADLSNTVSCKRSEDIPYAHSHPVRSFMTKTIDSVVYVITGGGEGTIRVWRYNDKATPPAFEHVTLFEGHIRAVTCLLFVDKFLWSGSMDCTIRVWDISESKCVGTLNAASNGGHTEAVCCLCLFSMPDGQPCIASGGMDNELKLWDTQGSFLHNFNEGACVTALEAFKDSSGNSALLVGLGSGRIIVRSHRTLASLFAIDSFMNGHAQAVLGIKDCGHGHFASVGNDGKLLVWKADQPFIEPS
jgi:WD40 repeat protein